MQRWLHQLVNPRPQDQRPIARQGQAYEKPDRNHPARLRFTRRSGSAPRKSPSPPLPRTTASGTTEPPPPPVFPSTHTPAPSRPPPPSVSSPNSPPPSPPPPP